MMESEELDLRPPDGNAATPEGHRDISRQAANELSYNEFFWNHMKSNWPVILTDASTDWECRLCWTLHCRKDGNECSDDNQAAPPSAINFDYLRKKVGNRLIPVADCSTEYFNSHSKIEMYFGDFLDYWQAKCAYSKSDEPNSNADEPTEKTTKNFYLKDWHLKSQMPDYEFYKVPKQFASDWLNEVLVGSGRDDYRFVYMGPKDSWTPFHADVFGSYSWSTNIVGCKKWILLPPGEELKLADSLGNLPFCIDENLLKKKDVEFFTLLQKENEAIFVPSAWYHQVWNLTDTISVNHNWFNACSVLLIWRNLFTNMRKVIAEIEDCRQMDNFDEHCQTMLRATFGMNYLDFLELLEYIAERRLSDCDNGNNIANVTSKVSSKCLLFDRFTLNDFHIRYDLQAIRGVLEVMLQDNVIYDSRPVLYRRCLRLMELTKGF